MNENAFLLPLHRPWERQAMKELMNISDLLCSGCYGGPDELAEALEHTAEAIALLGETDDSSDGGSLPPSPLGEALP